MVTPFMKIARALFNHKFILNPNTDDYAKVWQSVSNTSHGIQLGLIILLALTAAFVLMYYFVIASKTDSATVQNYLYIFVAGAISLVAVNFIVLALKTDKNMLFTVNMLRFTLVDLVYYIILFEVLSLIVKSISKASNIHLASIFLSK